MKAKRETKPRKQGGRRSASPSRAAAAAAWGEVLAALDEEVGRLPDAYRAPFVLCCLQGLPPGEAAGRLGVREHTVASRLARARDQVREALAGRGISLASVLTLLAISGETRPAVGAKAARRVASAAVRFAAGEGGVGVSPGCRELAEGELQGERVAPSVSAGAY